MIFFWPVSGKLLSGSIRYPEKRYPAHPYFLPSVLARISEQAVRNKFLHQVTSKLLASPSGMECVKIRLDTITTSWYLQTYCNFLKQFASSLWIGSLDNKLASIDNLQQTCYHQAGASDANASWYRLDDCKTQQTRTQSETPQTCCKLWILPACCKLSTNCSKSVDFIKLQQVCENQTYCNLIFADSLQVVETTCIKLVDKKSWQSTCSKPVDNLQQTCYHQAGASDANASWYRLDDSKVTSLQQTCCNLRVSGCVADLLLSRWSKRCKRILISAWWQQACFNLPGV